MGQHPVAVGQHQQILPLPAAPRSPNLTIQTFRRKGGAFSRVRLRRPGLLYAAASGLARSSCPGAAMNSFCRHAAKYGRMTLPVVMAVDRQQRCARPDRTILHNCLDRMTVYGPYPVSWPQTDNAPTRRARHKRVAAVIVSEHRALPLRHRPCRLVSNGRPSSDRGSTALRASRCRGALVCWHQFVPIKSKGGRCCAPGQPVKRHLRLLSALNLIGDLESSTWLTSRNWSCTRRRHDSMSMWRTAPTGQRRHRPVKRRGTRSAWRYTSAL